MRFKDLQNDPKYVMMNTKLKEEKRINKQIKKQEKKNKVKNGQHNIRIT